MPIQSKAKLGQLHWWLIKYRDYFILRMGIACIYTEGEINLETKCAPPDLPNHCLYVCDANDSESGKCMHIAWPCWTKRAREGALFVATGVSNVTMWLTRHMVCRIVALGVRGLSCPIVVLPSYRLPLSITIYNQQQVPALAPHWLTDRQWIGGRTGPFKKKKNHSNGYGKKTEAKRTKLFAELLIHLQCN